MKARRRKRHRSSPPATKNCCHEGACTVLCVSLHFCREREGEMRTQRTLLPACMQADRFTNNAAGIGATGLRTARCIETISVGL